MNKMDIRKGPGRAKRALWALGILVLGLAPARMDAQIFGIRGGMNRSTMRVEGDEEPYPMVPATGFQLGLSLDVPISRSLAFETGVWMSRKGGGYDRLDYNASQDLVRYNARWQTYWIDVPMLARVSGPAGGLELYGEFGFMLGFGMGGRYELETRYGGASSTYSTPIAWTSFGESERNLSPFDGGLLFGFGVGFDRFRVGASLNWGLMDLNSTFSYHYTGISNRSLALTATYLLNRPKAEG